MDYPLPGQYISDIERRRIALRALFKVELRKALKQGSINTLGGDFQEVAILKHEVVPESDFAYIKYFRLDTLRLLFTIRPKECIRLFQALRSILYTKIKVAIQVDIFISLGISYTFKTKIVFHGHSIIGQGSGFVNA